MSKGLLESALPKELGSVTREEVYEEANNDWGEYEGEHDEHKTERLCALKPKQPNLPGPKQEHGRAEQ